MQGQGRFKKIIGLLAVILLTTGLIYRKELVSAGKLFLHIQPAHARHIPRTAPCRARPGERSPA